jgi:hypothetical protein
MNASHWQAILAAVTIAVIVVAALVSQERRLTHMEENLLNQKEVIELYSRIAVIEDRLEIE